MSETRTILHVTGMHARKMGAFERYLIELARRCRAQGFRTVLQYESSPESPVLRAELESAGIDTVVCPTLAGPILSVFRVGGLIRRMRPSIVHAHFLNGYAHLAVPVVARRSGGRGCVVTVHSGVMDRKTDWHLRWAYSHYDRVMCVSEAIRRELLALGVPPEIVTTHYLGIFADGASGGERRAARRLLGLPMDVPVLACIARDGSEKGVDVLVDALSILARVHPRLQTIVFGVEAATSPLPALAAARGVAANVHWLGIRSDVLRLLAAADIYVQPSRLEGLGLAILEAMAAGLPVVASRVGGIPEAVADGVTGWLVAPDCAPLVAGAVDRLLNDPALAKSLGEAGRRRVAARFRADDSIQRTLDVYFGGGTPAAVPA